MSHHRHALQGLEPKYNEEEADDNKKPGGVEEKGFVCFSFTKSQMTEALARFGIFMRMETLKVGKPYDYMEVPPPPQEVQGLHAWSQANLSIFG